MDQEEIEAKKKNIENKISHILTNPLSLCLTIIILLSIIVRIYFFVGTYDQAHWWDSLAFGGVAKNMVYYLWDDNAFINFESVIRPPMLILLWYVFIVIGASEPVTIFFLEIVPSVLSIFFIYLISKEVFDKKTGLIAAAILSFSWIHLFYTMRIMSDIISLFFCLVSLYSFIKSYEDFNQKHFAIAIFFVSLALLTRYFYGIIGFIYLLFVIFVHKHKFLTNKKFWTGGLIGAIPLFIFFIVNLVRFGGIFPAGKVYAESAADKAIGYYVINFIPAILEKLLYVLFLFGLIIILFELFVGYDKIRESKNLRLRLLLFLVFLLPLIFFMFIIKAAEDRYWFLAFPAIIIFTSLAISTFYGFLKKYSKNFAILVVLGILLFGAYSQLTFAKDMISNKAQSYAQMKEAFLWIKENTPQEAVLLGDGIDPYAIYYSERRVLNHNETNIPEISHEVDYVILHGFEHQGLDLLQYVNNRTGTDFIPVKVVFFDAAQKTPAVIVYKVIKN